MSVFSNNMKRIREKKGITKAALSTALNISASAIAFYEKGEREPNLGNLKKIAEILEVSVDELLTPNSKVEPTKELHIYLDGSYSPDDTNENFESTELAIDLVEVGYHKAEHPIICTTQPHFCSWKYVNMGYRLFVHKGGHMIELKVGKNPSTDRLLKYYVATVAIDSSRALHNIAFSTAAFDIGIEATNAL